MTAVVNGYICEMKQFLYPLVLAVLLAGCDVIDYHPYDTRVKGVHGLIARNVERIEKNCAGRDMVRFAVGDVNANANASRRTGFRKKNDVVEQNPQHRFLECLCPVI